MNIFKKIDFKITEEQVRQIEIRIKELQEELEHLLQMIATKFHSVKDQIKSKIEEDK